MNFPEKLSVIKKLVLVNFTRYIFPLMSLFISLGMSFEMVDSITKKDYSFFLQFAQISLTLFGFTFLGGLFSEKRPPSVVLKIYESSIFFLASAIGFIFLRSILIFGNVVTKIEGITYYTVASLIFISMMAAFFGFLKIFSLFRLLLEHYIKLESRKRK